MQFLIEEMLGAVHGVIGVQLRNGVAFGEQKGKTAAGRHRTQRSDKIFQKVATVSM